MPNARLGIRVTELPQGDAVGKGRGHLQCCMIARADEIMVWVAIWVGHKRGRAGRAGNSATNGSEVNHDTFLHGHRWTGTIADGGFEANVWRHQWL